MTLSVFSAFSFFGFTFSAFPSSRLKHSIRSFSPFSLAVLAAACMPAANGPSAKASATSAHWVCLMATAVASLVKLSLRTLSPLPTRKYLSWQKHDSEKRHDQEDSILYCTVKMIGTPSLLHSSCGKHVNSRGNSLANYRFHL